MTELWMAVSCDLLPESIPWRRRPEGSGGLTPCRDGWERRAQASPQHGLKCRFRLLFFRSHSITSVLGWLRRSSTRDAQAVHGRWVAAAGLYETSLDVDTLELCASDAAWLLSFK